MNLIAKYVMCWLFSFCPSDGAKLPGRILFCYQYIERCVLLLLLPVTLKIISPFNCTKCYHKLNAVILER